MVWRDDTEATEIYKLASLYNNRANPGDISYAAPGTLPEESDETSFWHLPHLNVNKSTYRNALAYALALHKNKGNTYKEYRVSDSGQYVPVEIPNPEGTATAYAKDIDDVTRTFSSMIAANGQDYRDAPKYKKMNKEQKMVAVVHGLQFLKKAKPNWNEIDINRKNQMLYDYLQQYDPKTQMSAVEKDIYENGNYAAYADYFRNSDLEREQASIADRQQAIVNKQLEQQKQLQEAAAAKSRAEAKAIERAQLNERLRQQYDQILDHQGR